MKVLITGSNGFLGHYIKNVFNNDSIITVGRNNCDIIADLSIDNFTLPKVDSVIHAAGKAHFIPKTQDDIDSIFFTNVKGTENLLLKLEDNLPKYFLFISSVAVYGKSSGKLINENEQLCAIDPYGKSKLIAEKKIIIWCKNNKVRLCILRLPLLVGVNPPGNLNIMINAISKGYFFNISGGKACKSMVLAQDVAAIIPKAMKIGGIYNLTDGYHPSFVELSFLIAQQLNKRAPLNIPFWFAKTLSLIGDIFGKRALINTEKLEKMTKDLTFDDTKAKVFLEWRPFRVLDHFKVFQTTH